MSYANYEKLVLTCTLSKISPQLNQTKKTKQNKQTKKKKKRKEKNPYRSSCPGSAGMNLTSIHEDAGSITTLTQ